MSCTTCKKKKPVTKLEPVIEEWAPTNDEIKLAYTELTSYGGVKEDKKDFINKVYNFLFGEDFNFNCSRCDKRQARKFTNYLNSMK